ncbi:MAG: Cytidylate kinase [Myxococcaceae bacterium]|nr:Cytidylate kinase [Myxococcaceae bacterium]
MTTSSRARPIVAIDGPAGAGKSTVARRLADELGYVLVDTGAMYRVVALASSRASVAWSDGPGLGALADKLVQSAHISFERHPTRGLRVVLAGEDVSEAIRTPDMGMGASQVSAHAEVRAALLDLQRQAGRVGGVVLEGRDIGTVVFPEAEVKFYLTASPEVRARRRFEELVAKGEKVTFEQTLIDVERRDANDTGREHAPLRRADDAVLVDSSNMSIDDTVAHLAKRVRERERPG